MLYPSESCIEKYNLKYSLITKEIVRLIENEKHKLKKYQQKTDIANEFNKHSVVLELISKNIQGLYTGDLDIDLDDEYGLKYVITKLTKSNKIFNIFKVPHHGSETSYDKILWSSILNENAIQKLTCWKGSKSYLPKKEQIPKILEISESTYSTNNPENVRVDIPAKVKREYKKTGLTFNSISNDYGAIITSESVEKKLLVEPRNKAVHLREIL